MNRWLKIALVVAAVFAFAVVAMIVADPAHVPAHTARIFGLLMSPGMLIAFYWLHGHVLRPAFVLLSVALNILIYSGTVWLFLKIQRFTFRLGKSQD
jgi:hypothetical protein